MGAVGGTTATQAAAITTGAVGTGTITNDDSSTLTIDSPTVTEGTGGTTTLTFTVTSSAAVQGGFTVAFSAANGTADGSDYSVTTSSPLTFAGTAGKTTRLSSTHNTDAIAASNEQITPTLGALTAATPVPSAATTTRAVGTGTIDYTASSTRSIASPTVAERSRHDALPIFTVTSSAAVQGGFTVAFSAANGTADGSDYSVTTSSPLTFAG